MPQPKRTKNQNNLAENHLFWSQDWVGKFSCRSTQSEEGNSAVISYVAGRLHNIARQAAGIAPLYFIYQAHELFYNSLHLSSNLLQCP